MLSYHAMGDPQDGQRDRGLTTDSSAGHRAMQTFRKLPAMAPTNPARATTIDTGHASTVTSDLVQKNSRRYGDVE